METEVSSVLSKIISLRTPRILPTAWLTLLSSGSARISPLPLSAPPSALCFTLPTFKYSTEMGEGKVFGQGEKQQGFLGATGDILQFDTSNKRRYQFIFN